MIERQQVNEIEIGIFDLLLTLAKRKRFILLFTAFSALLVTIVCAMIPLKWESKTVIIPIVDDNAGNQIGTNLLGGLTDLQFIGSGKMDLAIDLVTIMSSRSFREDIVRKFRLIEYFNISEPDAAYAMEIALDKLNKHILKASIDQYNASITTSVVTSDNHFSQDIANYILLSLEFYVKYQKKTKSKIMREFLEGRTTHVKAQLDSILTIDKDFKIRGKAYSLDEQTKQALEVYSDLVSKKIMNDIELEIAKQQHSDLSPKVAELENKSNMLTSKIKDYEVNHTGHLPKYMLQLQNIPDINMQYSKIQIDKHILTNVYEYLYPLLEAAKQNELKEVSAIEIVDKANLSGKHIYPQRILLILLVTISAFILACLISVIDDNASLRQKQQILMIIHELSFTGKKPLSRITNDTDDAD